MPTAGPHTEAITGLGKADQAVQEAEHGRILRGRGLLQKVANVVTSAEDGHIALEHHHAHAGVLLSSGQGVSHGGIHRGGDGVFLSTRLKVMVVTPASVWTRMSLVVSVMVKEVNEERSSARRCAHSLVNDLVAGGQHGAGFVPQLHGLVENPLRNSCPRAWPSR